MTSSILHIITNFATRGGAETMLARLVNAMRDRPSIVAALMDVSDECSHLLIDSRVRFSALGSRSAAEMGMASFELAKLIRNEQPSAILCWMYHANVVGAIGAGLAGYRAPLIWNVRHSWDDRKSESLSTRLAVYAGRALRRLPSGIIFNSNRSLEQHATIGYRHVNSRVIPNGFVLPLRASRALRKPQAVGIAARFHPQKDFRNFLSAATRVLARQPHIEFVAAGSGVNPDNPDFSRLVAQTGAERVRLLGEIQNMTDFYRSLDLFVLSSSFGEGFPNVLAEAMSHGVPCVTTNVGDSAHVVGETGIVVPPRDPDALAQAILTMLVQSPEEYTYRSAAARERVERLFDIKAVARQYDDFIFSSPKFLPRRSL